MNKHFNFPIDNRKENITYLLDAEYQFWKWTMQRADEVQLEFDRLDCSWYSIRKRTKILNQIQYYMELGFRTMDNYMELLKYYRGIVK